ncbi:MAG TPA: aldo/keto reductase [Candidatus Dormibacteraeota bacterium]|jgi:aryl-alcohol dehydrogenase-like predicted oxidoreductase|nr:aldo/keto reductase [Candidatus Dormibacteraeota bacterium]
METRNLGTTPVSVSAIGFGGWVLGTSWWGTLTEEEGTALVRHALDRGITFFDTADSYGDDGISETLLATALSGVPRDQYVLGTKFGYDITLPRSAHGHSERPQRWDAAFIRRACEDSLRRLGTDVIDVYEMHNPRMDAIDDDEAFATLSALRDEGKIRSFGVALGPAIGWEEEGVRALRERRVQVVQTVYNVLEQDPGRRFLAEASAVGAGVLARVPHASGALEGKITKETTFAAGDHRSFRNRQMLVDLLDKAETLRWLHESGQRTIAQLALQYAVAQPGISSVLPTMTTVEQLDEFTAATQAPPLSDDELHRVDALYADNFGVERREYARR